MESQSGSSSETHKLSQKNWRPPVADIEIKTQFTGNISYLDPEESVRSERFRGLDVGIRVTTPHNPPVIDAGIEVELPLKYIRRIEVRDPIPHKDLAKWPSRFLREEIPRITILVTDSGGTVNTYSMYATHWWYYLAEDATVRGLHPCRVKEVLIAPAPQSGDSVYVVTDITGMVHRLTDVRVVYASAGFDRITVMDGALKRTVWLKEMDRFTVEKANSNNNHTPSRLGGYRLGRQLLSVDLVVSTEFEQENLVEPVASALEESKRILMS